MRERFFSSETGDPRSGRVAHGDVMRLLVNGLKQPPGSRGRAAMLLGRHGSGKTPLLLELVNRADTIGDIAADPTPAARGMMARIVRSIQDNGNRRVRPERIPYPPEDAAGSLIFSSGLEFSREVREGKSPAYQLTQLVRKLNSLGHGVLLLVDDLRADVPEVRQLTAAYQELVGEGLDVAMVMAGIPENVDATLSDNALAALNRARKIRLEQPGL